MDFPINEEKYLPINEEQYFAVQLILRTKTKVGEEPDYTPDKWFMSDLVEECFHPEFLGNNYVLTSSQSSIYFTSQGDYALPLKIVEHNRFGMPSVEEIKPVFYHHDKDGYTSPVDMGDF